jgi:hypothetical protein
MKMPGPFISANKQAAHNAWIPSEFNMGFPKITNKPRAPTQYQHISMITTRTINHGLIFWGRAALVLLNFTIQN